MVGKSSVTTSVRIGVCADACVYKVQTILIRNLFLIHTERLTVLACRMHFRYVTSQIESTYKE